MAKTRLRIFDPGAVALLVRSVWRIDGDAQHVRSRRNRRLAVAAVEDEVLPAQLENVGVRPAVADSLMAGDSDAAAVPELPCLRRLAQIRRVRIGVEHAEAALGRFPDEARVRIDQL